MCKPFFIATPLPVFFYFPPDLLSQPGHFIYTPLPCCSGTVGTVGKLICIVAQPCHLAEQIGVVRAGARMDFFAYNERAQVFLSVQTAGRNLPIQE